MFGLFKTGASVLVSPHWKSGTIVSVADDRVHVSMEDGRMAKVPRRAVAICGIEPSQGREVLVEVGGSRRRGQVLDVRNGRARVQVDEDAQWYSVSALAVFMVEEPPRRDPVARARTEAKAKARAKDGRKSRKMWWWRNSSLVVLGFGLAGLAFGFIGIGGWGVALTWFSLHAILAAYVVCHDQPLPSFHRAGFGKPSNPGFSVPGFELERAPLRSQWELALMMLGGWLVVGVGMSAGDVVFIGPLYVCLVGLGCAALARAHDRGSALEARRLLGAAPIVGLAHSGEGRLLGTVAEDDSKEPALWRQVLQYSWSVSRQVTKTITDQDGNQRTVQETETSHYACGFRRERTRKSVRIETTLGSFEIPLQGIVWAGERTLSFEPRTEGEGWRPPKPSSSSLREQAKVSTFERIDAGCPVVVLGALRQGGGELPQIVGGEAGPVVLFGEGEGEGEPVAALAGLVRQRRVLLAAMVVLGLGSLLAI